MTGSSLRLAPVKITSVGYQRERNENTAGQRAQQADCHCVIYSVWCSARNESKAYL